MKPREVKDSLGKPVVWKDKSYVMDAYILRVRNGKLFYQAELKEIDRNSVMIVNLSEVEALEPSNL